MDKSPFPGQVAQGTVVLTANADLELRTFDGVVQRHLRWFASDLTSVIATGDLLAE